MGQQQEKRLRREIQKIVAASKRQDALESEEFGPDFRGDELPAELSRRKIRLQTIRDAKKRLEVRKATLAARGIDGYVSVGREGKDGTKIVSHLPAARAMKRKLGTKRGRATYKKRKHTRPNRASAARGPTVEPVFGWIKASLGFRQLSLRGLEKVNAEWDLVCSAINLRRMAGRLRWA